MKKVTIVILTILISFAATTTDVFAQNLTQQYQYNVASVSKIYVTTAVMQLSDKGKIDLDAPLTNYIPEFTMADPRYQDITPRMLLEHTSGLMGAHYLNKTVFGEADPAVKDQLLDQLAVQKLKADPGTYAVYCNDGFTLAQILVERVSGMPFCDYMEKYICNPLDMYNTVDSFSTKVSDVPQMTNFFNGTLKMPMESQCETGSGGVKSTTDDLCKLSTVFMGEHQDILSERSAKQMMENAYQKTSYLKVDGENAATYGMGFDATELYPFNQYGIKAVCKGGDLSYQHASLIILPEEKMSAAVTSSGGSSMFDQMAAEAILMAALEVDGRIKPTNAYDAKTIAKQYEKLDSAVIPEKLREFEGYYSFGTKIGMVEFPDESHMRITVPDETHTAVQEYRYTSDQWFVGELGKYIMSGLQEAEGGQTGISKLQLREEKDGTRYIASYCYGTLESMGTYAQADRAAIQIAPVQIQRQIQETWDARTEQTYFLVNANWNSTSYSADKGAGATLKFRKALIPGYIESESGLLRVQQLIDADHSKTAAICRDMTTVSCYHENGTEYISMDDLGFVFESGENMKELPQESIDCSIQEENRAVWFHITDHTDRQRAVIQIDGNASIQVYNRHGELIYSSLMLNAGSAVMLPEDGYVSYIGEQGAKVKMSYE